MPSASAALTTAITLASDPPDLASEEPGPATGLLAIAGVCLVLAILASVASSSLLLYSPTKLARALNGQSKRLLEQLTEHRASYRALARLLSILGLTSAGILCWEASDDAMIRSVTFGAFAVLAFIGCGVLPGGFAENRAERVVAIAQRALEFLRAALHYPVLLPMLTIGNLLLRMFRVPESEDCDDDIADDILAAVEDHAEAGLDEDERGWIENIVDLGDTQASEVMTPRTDAIAFDRELPLLEAIERATEAGYSRFPVYEGKVDHVIGVFYAKDVLPLVGQNGTSASDKVVGDYMRKPLFVPETIDVVDLLQQFRTSRVQMAIVLDEYGGTAGLVSIEDVLEEIVGEIDDEYDAKAEQPIKVIEEGRVVETSGRVRIEEINEVLPIEIPEAEDYDTVAGFVFTSLDRIPAVGESAEIEGVEFQVLEGDERRIHRLRLTVTAASPQV